MSFSEPGGGEDESGEVCCRHCRRDFASLRAFDAHRCRSHLSSIAVERTGDKKFLCTVCGKTFTQKISLQYHHIYVHNGERKAACPHCDYRAPDKAKLSVHLRTHSKLRPFVCELCKATFKFRSTYRSHVARHTNSGNYVCSQCNKAFTMASELREHRRIHGQERPFVCPLCAMTFKQKKQLRVHHRAVHLRDKRYVCEVCGACHINNWNLRAHMKTHVQADIACANFCKLCGSIFRGRAGLAAHMRLRHGDEAPQPKNQVVVWEEEEDEEDKELVKKLEENYQKMLSEAIEHVVEPQAKHEVKMIEVYSCSCCGQLCESLEQLRAHSFTEH
ncbi:Zinc finger protein 41 [Chionoecetes opilio]|uniref:Zinc finger protein 41 n=1 Tax=Chionoecetes opilio TaxID=41210 RepID=A0A8J4YG20_CHIOP|nr:Zinc finger protein 41 [Chionoecetes opilio]